PMATLSGTLVIPVRDHPEKFEVLLLSTMGEREIAFTYLDITNRFFFENIPDGEYDVVIRVDGFKELREHVKLTFEPFDLTPCEQHGTYWLTPVDTIEVVDERLRVYPKEAIVEYVLAIDAHEAKNFDE